MHVNELRADTHSSLQLCYTQNQFVLGLGMMLCVSFKLAYNNLNQPMHYVAATPDDTAAKTEYCSAFHKMMNGWRWGDGREGEVFDQTDTPAHLHNATQEHDTPIEARKHKPKPSHLYPWDCQT